MQINKVVRLGKTKETFVPCNVYCKIKYDGKRLSIVGVEGPTKDGNCHGSCGQCTGFQISEPAPGWTPEMLETFRGYWNRWHLNDMTAGTPAQMEELRRHACASSDHYTWAKETLKAAGLEPDKGYSYGSKWLLEEVPQEVLEWLAALPETDITPAWV